MSGIANLSMDHSRSDECLNKSSSPNNPTSSDLKPNSSGVNLSAQAGTEEAETMNCLLSTSSRFEVTKTSTDGSHVILHDGDGDAEDQEPLNNTIDSDEQVSPVGSYDNQHTFGAPTYRTVYQTNKSLRHYTKEALPRIDNYRNMMSIQGQLVRPTVEELRGIQTTVFDGTTVSSTFQIFSFALFLHFSFAFSPLFFCFLSTFPLLSLYFSVVFLLRFPGLKFQSFRLQNSFCNKEIKLSYCSVSTITHSSVRRKQLRGRGSGQGQMAVNDSENVFSFFFLLSLPFSSSLRITIRVQK